MGISDYLSNSKVAQKIAQQQKDKYGDDPAALFLASQQNDKFPTIVLFKKFGVANDGTLTLPSDITTNYAEDMVAIQDHWALPPITYVMSGLIGEVVYSSPTSWATGVQNILSPLQPIAALVPTLGSYTQAAVNVATQIQSSVDRYIDIAKAAISQWTGLGVQQTSNQQYIVQKLMDARLNRQLVTVATPYGVFDSMAIANVVVRETGSKYQSNVEISLQQWRSTNVETRKATEEELALLAQIQKAASEDTGVAREKESALASISGHSYKDVANSYNSGGGGGSW